jgi:hypothetical protein
MVVLLLARTTRMWRQRVKVLGVTRAGCCCWLTSRRCRLLRMSRKNSR